MIVSNIHYANSLSFVNIKKNTHRFDYAIVGVYRHCQQYLIFIVVVLWVEEIGEPDFTGHNWPSLSYMAHHHSKK